LLIFGSFLFGVALCLLYNTEGSLWGGMTVHFINNASVNLLHVVSSSGADAMQTLRITIAQTILFIAVSIRCVRQKSKKLTKQTLKETEENKCLTKR
jgi:membrane protease YdiL (CAAX protease family)